MSDTYTPTVAEMVDKLQALGSANQIAQFLAAEGVMGQRDLTSACPLATYLIRKTGNEVSVCGAWVRVGRHPHHTVIDTTRTPIHDFVAGFDLGRYPELIEGAGE